MRKLGFSVEELLPRARGGGALKMGLAKVDEDDWLQPHCDDTERVRAFADYPQGIQLAPGSEAPGAELAAMLGLAGGLPQAAVAHHEDMCLLTLSPGADQYRLVGAAVAWPSDWSPADKIGLPMRALHAPIHGYEEQLASGVDHFMAKLTPGPIYGRANWFVTATGSRHWQADDPDIAFAGATAENAGETLFVRCERQTLRRLPETGAIVFTIGVYVEPVGNLPAQSVRWLADAVRAIPAGERERRGIGAYLPALIGYAENIEAERRQ